MTGVNGQRGYDATGRRDRARQRRREIVLVATEMFERRGYAVTVADIAERAGVSPETIYKSFGGKAGLLKEAFDQALAGDDEPVAVADRPESRAIDAEPDITTKLSMYATVAATRSHRAGRLMLVIRDGARSDDALATLWADALGQRLRGMTMLATHLAETGDLRTGVSMEDARDTLWTLISPEIYELLVVQRGWSVDGYRDWITRAMIAELI
ncbi:TetR/AcrR family transcriptional regulator [Gordonia insulae]|uniref:HTH-type transcriptional regulator BetI n=1 Tax=Gordonia insulae TaxID=2420509 RepID=A0A3G8JJ91_9ACTN|nr:helix-turn-helix domain-containing protein [Gordonia insulae]AZG45073.1 HTH-type transcriptional regulator BetI [Gordonia insulae]